MLKSERQLRREQPLPEISLPSDVKPEESLAASKPHVAPADEKKGKAKRTVSTTALRRQRENKEKAMERSQKMEKRRGSVESKKDKKKKAKMLWES